MIAPASPPVQDATTTPPPRLPARCTMTDRQWKARQNRFKKLYPTVGAWVAAHPGQAAGRVVGTVPPVRYYKTPNGYGWTFARNWEPSHYEVEVTREEFRASLGLDEAPSPGDPGGVAVTFRLPESDTMPTWPPTPDDLSPGRKPRKTKTRDDVLADIARLVKKHHITGAELSRLLPADGVLLG